MAIPYGHGNFRTFSFSNYAGGESLLHNLRHLHTKNALARCHYLDLNTVLTLALEFLTSVRF